jgi:hypothetical protein
MGRHSSLSELSGDESSFISLIETAGLNAQSHVEYAAEKTKSL